MPGNLSLPSTTLNAITEAFKIQVGVIHEKVSYFKAVQISEQVALHSLLLIGAADRLLLGLLFKKRLQKAKFLFCDWCQGWPNIYGKSRDEKTESSLHC